MFFTAVDYFSSGEKPSTLAWYIFLTGRVLTARQMRDNIDELTRNLRAQASDLKVEHGVASIQL